MIKKQETQQFSEAPNKQPATPLHSKRKVTFIYSYQAQSVYIVGDFNDWDIHCDEMVAKDGAFQLTLWLKTGRDYRFLYWVDESEWQVDWRADKYVHTPINGDTSVVSL